jgi:hypothetical protein
MIKIISLVVIMIVVYSAGAFALYEAGKYFDSRDNSKLESFDDCVASGYSVIQVYPRVCVDDLGNTYTEIVTGE